MKPLLQRGGALLVLAACSSPAPTPRSQAVVVAGPPSAKTTNTPRTHEPAPTTPARRTIALDDFARCLLDAGHLHCWDGHRPVTGAITRTVPAIPFAEPVTSIDVGPRSACAVTRDGRVHCWGSNLAGQLGAGMSEDRAKAPITVLGLADATAVALAHSHACALRRNGNVSCWGDNMYGQCGHDTAYTPDARRLVRAVEVSGVEDAIQVAVGSRYSCAVTADARTVCWGWTPPFGEIRPRPDKDVTPRTIDELNGASELALRGDWGCAVITAQGGKKQHSSAGRVRCWGLAHSGRLGHTQPKAGAYVDGLMDAVHVAIGSAHACAIRRDRSVVCWGNPRNGGLGRSDVREDGDPRALAVDARFDASELALGSSVACARTAASILCWGSEPFEEGTHLLAPQSLPIR